MLLFVLQDGPICFAVVEACGKQARRCWGLSKKGEITAIRLQHIKWVWGEGGSLPVAHFMFQPLTSQLAKHGSQDTTTQRPSTGVFEKSITRTG